MTTQRILAAAEALFAAQGYDRTTIDEIAHRAGLTKGAVYYFYKNKAELFCTIVDQGVSYIEEQCRTLMDAQRSGSEIAQDIISLYTSIAYDNINLFLILCGNQSGSPDIRMLFHQRIRRLIDCVRSVMQAGMEEGMLRPMNPDVAARMFIGLIYGMLALPDRPGPEEAAQAIRSVFEQGIFADRKENPHDPAHA